MNDREFYEQFWRGFQGPLCTQLAIHSESRRPLLNLLGEQMTTAGPTRSLEAGCGTAIDSCLLAARHPGLRAYACDLSEHAVQLARDNARALGVKLSLFCADLTRMPLADNSFDLVFSQGVLEHFPDPSSAMREQARVLRPSGTLVVDVPQKYNLYTVRKKRAMRENRWSWGWETQYSVAELKAWAPSYGLQVVGAVGYQHGRLVDRLLMHPHRTLARQWAKLRGRQTSNGYKPGPLALTWEGLWDRLDAFLGPHLAINVAVAFRKLAE